MSADGLSAEQAGLRAAEQAGLRAAEQAAEQAALQAIQAEKEVAQDLIDQMYEMGHKAILPPHTHLARVAVDGFVRAAVTTERTVARSETLEAARNYEQKYGTSYRFAGVKKFVRRARVRTRLPKPGQGAAEAKLEVLYDRFRFACRLHEALPEPVPGTTGEHSFEQKLASVIQTARIARVLDASTLLDADSEDY